MTKSVGSDYIGDLVAGKDQLGALCSGCVGAGRGNYQRRLATTCCSFVGMKMCFPGCRLSFRVWVVFVFFDWTINIISLLECEPGY
jgi:hypothetical protein